MLNNSLRKKDILSKLGTSASFSKKGSCVRAKNIDI